MAIDIQFLYRNLVDPNKAYESVDDFFDSTYTGTTDEEDLQKHHEVNSKYIYERMSVLTPDKKHFAMVNFFLKKGINIFCEKPLDLNIKKIFKTFKKVKK